MRNAMIVPRSIGKNAIALSPRAHKHIRAVYEELDDRKQLREIGEFSSSYETTMRRGIFLAAALIFFSIICLVLFILDVNTALFFSVGALTILLQLLQCGYELSQECLRTQHAYHTYLTGFSDNVLYYLRRTAKLSAWSKYEIDKYIESIS